MSRTHYTSEFRQEAVKIAMSSNDTVATTARNLGINESTLYNWVSRTMKEKTTPKHTLSNNSKNYRELEKENRELQKKLKKAKMERDILKKAAVGSIGQRIGYYSYLDCRGPEYEKNVHPS